MMYLLFRYKNWEPEKYCNASPEVRKVYGAFMQKEIEEKIKEYK